MIPFDLSQNLYFVEIGSVILSLPIVVLYLGPETIMPVTSFLAAILGIVLMFWQKLVLVVRMTFVSCRKMLSRSQGDTSVKKNMGLPDKGKSSSPTQGRFPERL